MESIMNVIRFKVDFMFSQLREPYNKSDWRQHPDAVYVNAKYEMTQNYIGNSIQSL